MCWAPRSFKSFFRNINTNEGNALCVGRTTGRSATSKDGSAVTMLTYIWEVIGSKLDRLTRVSRSRFMIFTEFQNENPGKIILNLAATLSFRILANSL